MAGTSKKLPSFGPLIKFTLESVGIDYISLDHLRKAKKNETNPREILELFMLLHDLILVILVDFDIEKDAFKKRQKEEFEKQLFDEKFIQIRQEMIHFYLYQWGFVCQSFYSMKILSSSNSQEEDSTTNINSKLLLLAFAWLLGYSNFFERQSNDILQLSLATRNRILLPPYTNDILLEDEEYESIIDYVAQDYQDQKPLAGSSLEHLIDALHAAYGRLQCHSKELVALQRYQSRLLEHLQKEQQVHGVFDKEEQVPCLPAYAIELLQNPQRLGQHQQAIEKRLAMYEQEQLFYKWINSVLLDVCHSSPTTGPTSPASPRTDSTTTDMAFPMLTVEIESTKKKFQEIFQVFTSISQIWTSQYKKQNRNSKTTAKMEELAQQITMEMPSITSLYLDTKSKEKKKDKENKDDAFLRFVALKQEECRRFEQELTQVFDQITQIYQVKMI